MSEPVSKVVRRTKHFIENPSRMLTKLMVRHCPELVPDKQYILYLWEQKMDYPLDLKNPRTFNEKLQWLKLYDRKPEYTTMVDKYRVKQWVADRIGEEYVIPTLAVYQSVDEIDLDKLPDQFVLKCNHDSGGVFICKDKSTFDLKTVKEKLARALKINYFYAWREWPYKNIKPQIFAEAYLEDTITHSMSDYKFFTFGGKVKVMFIATDRNNPDTETKFDFFDSEFNHIDVKNGHPNADTPPSKPKCFTEMIQLAETLSKGIPHVRCDFYEINGKVFFGEMTFFHWAGLVPFDPPSFDRKMGDWLDLKQVIR